MTQDDDRQPGNPDEQQPEYDANPFEKAKRQEPTFNDFEEDEDLLLLNELVNLKQVSLLDCEIQL